MESDTSVICLNYARSDWSKTRREGRTLLLSPCNCVADDLGHRDVTCEPARENSEKYTENYLRFRHFGKNPSREGQVFVAIVIVINVVTGGCR